MKIFVCQYINDFDIAGSLFTVMADLPFSIHSLSYNCVSDEGSMAISEAMKKMTNLLHL